MKNRAKKIIAISLGICFLALWFIFLFFVATKPYTEKVVIWLPDNYELENNVKNGVVSIMPTPIDNSHQSNKVFYSTIGMESFKRLFGRSKREISVKMQDGGLGFYQIIYQTKFDCADKDKSFIVVAQEYYKCNRRILSEMRLKDRALFLKYKRNTLQMYNLLLVGFLWLRLLYFFT